MDVLEKYGKEAAIVQNCLNGLTGNVYHSADSRDALADLGLIEVGIDLNRRFPYGPDEWLQIKQEVIAVMSGLARDAKNHIRTRDRIIQAGYPEEVRMLMREQPTDAPSQAKCVEFIRFFSEFNDAYANM